MKYRKVLFTYSGKLSFPGGAPCLFDMAVQLSRECRYAGAGMRWWPVVLHTFVVCDLLPEPLKIHGLAHDTPETITGDVPKPVKTKEIEKFENMLLRSIYQKTFRIPLPTKAEHSIIKSADTNTLCGEVYTVGTRRLQDIYPRCPQAEELVMKYLNEYPPLECINPDGRAPIEFLRRARLYMDMWRSAHRRH